MIEFVSDREIQERVVCGLVPEVRQRLWRATADIEELHVEAGGRTMCRRGWWSGASRCGWTTRRSRAAPLGNPLPAGGCALCFAVGRGTRGHGSGPRGRAPEKKHTEDHA